MYYGLAFICGCFIVLSIIFNGKVSEVVGAKQASLTNFIVGLFTISVIMLALWNRQPEITVSAIPLQYYLGGCLGVAVVVLSSVVINKLSVVDATVLTFLGQMTAAMFIDFLLKSTFDISTLIGSGVLLIGLMIHTYGDKKEAVRQSCS